MQKQIQFYSILIAAVLFACFIIAFAACYYIGAKNIPGVQFQGRIFQPDPILGFSRIPDASGFRHEPSGAEYQIYTNDVGARVNGPGEKTPASVDLLSIGCSYTEGLGIDNRQTYTSLVGEKLHINALNFAVSGYGSVGSLLMLQRVANLHPKIVIYGLIEAHIYRNLSPCMPSGTNFCLSSPYITFDERHHPYIVPVKDNLRGAAMTIEAVSLAHERNLFTTAWYGLKILWYSRDPSLRNHEVMERDWDLKDKALKYSLTQMKATTDRIGASLIVVYIPRMSLKDARPFSRWQFLIPKGVHFVDTTGALVAAMRAQHKEELSVVPGDGHPSAEAHAIIAGEIVKYIETNKLLSLPAATNR